MTKKPSFITAASATGQARVHPYVLKAAELLFAGGPDNALVWRKLGRIRRHSHC